MSEKGLHLSSWGGDGLPGIRSERAAPATSTQFFKAVRMALLLERSENCFPTKNDFLGENNCFWGLVLGPLFGRGR